MPFGANVLIPILITLGLHPWAHANNSNRPIAERGALKRLDWAIELKTIEDLRSTVAQQPLGDTVDCTITTPSEVKPSYVVFTNPNGVICRILDLGFPNAKQWVSALLSADSNIDPTLSEQAQILSALPLARNANAWVQALNPNGSNAPDRLLFSELPNAPTTQTALPAEFLALLKWSLESQNAFATLATPTLEEIYQSTEIVFDPTKNVYQVLLNFDFLPIFGPVVLYDRTVPYLPWLNGTLRSAFFSILYQSLSLVPNRTAAEIIAIGLEDLHDQFNIIELSRVRALQSNFAKSTDVVWTLSGQDTTTLLPLFLRMFQGEKLGFHHFKDAGRFVHQTTLRNLKTRSDQTFSELALDHTDCNPTALSGSQLIGVAACETDGRVVSLTHRVSALFSDLGPNIVFRPSEPTRVFYNKLTRYLASTGARLSSVFAIPRFISSRVSFALKSYAMDTLLLEAEIANEHILSDEAPESIRGQIMANTLSPLMEKDRESFLNLVEFNRQSLKNSIHKREGN